MKHNRLELLSLLSTLTPGVDSGGTLEHSSAFLFTGTEVRTYNDQVTARRLFKSTFTGAVEAEKLVKLLTGLSVDDVDLSGKEGGGEVLVRAGKAEAGLTLTDADPAWLKSLVVPKKWFPLPTNFLKAVRACVFSASKDMTRPVLACLNLTPKVVESCDNYRATRVTLTGPLGPTGRVAVKSLQSILTVEGVKGWSVTEDWVHFQTIPGTIISARMFGAEPYPNLDPFFSIKGNTLQLPENIRDLVDRAHVFAEADFSQDERLTVNVSPNLVTVSGKGVKGWYKESAKCLWKGDPIVFDVHPSLFGDLVDLDREVVVGDTMLKLTGSGLVHVVILGVEE